MGRKIKFYHNHVQVLLQLSTSTVQLHGRRKLPVLVTVWVGSGNALPVQSSTSSLGAGVSDSSDYNTKSRRSAQKMSC